MWILYMILGLVSAIIIHEGVHLLIACLLRFKVTHVALLGIIFDIDKHSYRFDKAAIGSYVKFFCAKPTVQNLLTMYSAGALGNLFVFVLFIANTNKLLEIFALMNLVIGLSSLIPIVNMANDGAMLYGLIKNSKETILYFKVSQYLTTEYTKEFFSLAQQVVDVLSDNLANLAETHIIIYLSYLNYVTSMSHNDIDDDLKSRIDVVFSTISQERTFKSKYFQQYLVGEVITHKLINRESVIYNFKLIDTMPSLVKKRIRYLSKPNDFYSKRIYLEELSNMSQGVEIGMVRGENSYVTSNEM